MVNNFHICIFSHHSSISHRSVDVGTDVLGYPRVGSGDPLGYLRPGQQPRPTDPARPALHYDTYQQVKYYVVVTVGVGPVVDKLGPLLSVIM